MGQLEEKKIIKIQHKKRNLNEVELNVNNNLNKTREKIKKSIDFPFMFLDEDYNEIHWVILLSEKNYILRRK